jgi:hypothetical protein
MLPPPLAVLASLRGGLPVYVQPLKDPPDLDGLAEPDAVR